jgi:DNA-directed RNA polymerase specialized sigma24 family protein
MKHKVDLDARLENWAKAQRYGSAGGSVIGSAEGRYRGDNPAPRSIDSMLLDHADADIVERAWQRLMRFDRDVLHMHYILRMDYRVICRRLKLPKFSESTFLMALAHAKQQIGKVLETIAETRPVQKGLHRSYDVATEN